MGTIVKKGLPCESCGSSDAVSLYDNGTSFCFSCTTFFSERDSAHSKEDPEVAVVRKKSPSVFRKKQELSIEEISELQVRGFKDRGITKTICEFFDVRVSYGSNGLIDSHYYPYVSGDTTSYKQRVVDTKNFFWVGEPGKLFGVNKFFSGGKCLVITEGEIDALSVAQAWFDKYEKIYPVISLTSATGVKSLLEYRDWIRSFEEVVIWFDNDEPGIKAVEKALKIIGIDKAKIVNTPDDCKDANDVLIKFGWSTVLSCIWNAKPWKPSGIITKEELWDALSNYNELVSIPYPSCLAGVNSKLKGMRLGEIVLLVAGTGSGKSTILREMMLNVLYSKDISKDAKIGIVSLEESPAETARKLSGMYLHRNPSASEIPLEELQEGFDAVFGDDRIIILDHQGSMSDANIIDQLEYMALMGCKYLFIDHITILVSEGSEGLKGNEAIDKIMNDLLRLTKRHNIWIGLVSHLRKTLAGGHAFESGHMPSLDDIRGSGSIKQISFDVIAFARNLNAEDEIERNLIKMAVLKSRYTGLTGNVEGCVYIHETGRLVRESAMNIYEV